MTVARGQQWLSPHHLLVVSRLVDTSAPLCSHAANNIVATPGSGAVGVRPLVAPAWEQRMIGNVILGYSAFNNPIKKSDVAFLQLFMWGITLTTRPNLTRLTQTAMGGNPLGGGCLWCGWWIKVIPGVVRCMGHSLTLYSVARVVVNLLRSIPGARHNI